MRRFFTVCLCVFLLCALLGCAKTESEGWQPSAVTNAARNEGNEAGENGEEALQGEEEPDVIEETLPAAREVCLYHLGQSRSLSPDEGLAKEISKIFLEIIPMSMEAVGLAEVENKGDGRILSPEIEDNAVHLPSPSIADQYFDQREVMQYFSESDVERHKENETCAEIILETPGILRTFKSGGNEVISESYDRVFICLSHAHQFVFVGMQDGGYIQRYYISDIYMDNLRESLIERVESAFEEPNP